MCRRLVVFTILCSFTMVYTVTAQELITSTPVRINIPTDAAPAIEIIVTSTVTRTPTPNAILLEAKESAGEVNVRAEADIESERVGTIRTGEFYPVLGRYFRWIQFQFESSPTGRGWIFDELVNIVGDTNAIPDLSQGPLPTADPLIEAVTQTQGAITQTPGGILTLTAESRILPVPGQAENLATGNGDQSLNVEPASVLPTFTFPPDIVAVAPTAIDVTLAPATSPEANPLSVPNRLPPLVPIILLGGMGLLGLAVSALRR